MRLVYCKCDDINSAERCAIRLSNILQDKGLKPIIKEKRIVDCNGYSVEFCNDRIWLTLTSTYGGRGYLTIPYNHILISSRGGVKQEDCTMQNLIRLIEEGVEY